MKYSRKQIAEAIKYWTAQLKKMDEAKEYDLTQRQGSIGQVLMAHRDEVLNMPSSADAKEYLQQLFMDEKINTPKSREILMKLDQMTTQILNPRKNFEQTAVYLNDVIMKAQGLGMTRRGRGR